MHKFCYIIFIVLIQISAIQSVTVSTSRQVRNLTAFNRLFGYIRHFHPSDEAQEIDWDKFASYGAGKVINADNDKELISVLNDLFIPVAPSLMIHASGQDKGYEYKQLIPPNKSVYKTTCWQYMGYQNQPESFYHSFRTNRPLKIKKDKPGYYVEAFLTPIFPKLAAIPDSMRLSIDLRKTDEDTLKYGIYGVCEYDHQEDSLSSFNREHKTFTFGDIYTDQPALWIYLGDFTKVLLYDVKCEALIDNRWTVVYYNDFSSSTPGQMPEGFNVNCSPFYGQSPDNEITVEHIDGKNLLSIRQSTSDLPYTPGYFTKLFDEELPPETVIDKPLVKGLSCFIPLSLYCTQSNTYPPADQAKLSCLKENLALIDTHDRTNRNNYLAALFMYWNELQHFFPYWQYTDTDWNKDFDKALRQTLKCDKLRDFVLIMSELASQTKDSHSTFYDDKIDRKMPGFNAELLESKWIVTKVADTAISIPIGSQLTYFNGKPIGKYIDSYRKYFVTGTKQHAEKYLFTRVMRSYEDSTAVFSFITPDHKKVTQQVSFGLYTVAGWYNREGKFKQLTDDICYVNLGQLGVNSAEFDSLLTGLTKAKGIIFDLRDYPQRTNFINYLLTKSDTLLCHYLKRSIYPDCEFLPNKEHYRDRWALQPMQPHIAAKCVFLCGAYSVSYCESVLMELKYNQLGTIIGQPTAGVTGNVITCSYPCDLGAWWTGLFILNPDGTRFHGVGIIPDIIVPRTIDDVVKGRDAELETALRFLQNEK